MEEETRAMPDCVKDDIYWPSNLCGINFRRFSQEQIVEAECSASSLF